MIGVPTVADARLWTGASVEAIPDADLEQIHAAELAIQARLLAIPDDPDADGNEGIYPEPLARSLLRRIARQIAAKALPLGLVGGEASEWSPVTVRSWDAEIDRLEGSYVIPVIA